MQTFGPDPDTGARITSLDEYKTFLDHFQAAGFTEIDTARSYVGGKQEAFTREAGCRCWGSLSFPFLDHLPERSEPGYFLLTLRFPREGERLDSSHEGLPGQAGKACT